ncbi:membrane fusion protein, multidrug efflux system [Vreelandella subterranea]|uniref:Membrane fusion protein, multidrug efflux system n=1 Tax=Vreelandella subterranea TaxID=416874 RepID=A0A1H9WFM1_9GAMM|nr:efflux RND transporter periplasmic adaptor subunit [Halomonas subterranea]SES32589.1 membrane fusion protein, multidrug efflux system [Halomonas subterranea]
MKNMFYGVRSVLMVIGASALLVACGQEEQADQAQGQQQEPPPHPVEVTEATRQDLPLEKSYSSLLRSDDEVTLVARVTGYLQERHFEPGEFVEEGQLLYSIEPDVYRATVNQREADLQSARAEFARAQRDAERFERLLNQNSVSRQDYDQARADLGVAQANVAQAEAALESAQIDLNYAEVTAPVAGMISLSEINVGNLVQSGTELATVTPLDPLEVRFQMPQNDAFALRRQLREGMAVEDIRATLALPGRDGRDDQTLEGRLDYLGSRVSDRTSTVQASATFDNPDGEILPGQFVRVSIEGLKRYGVYAVPEIAVTQGLMGPQVFVLDEDDRARSRTVSLGEVAGAWQILREGLEEGDRVVVGDPSGIEPGTAIDPQPFGGDAEAVVENVEEAQQAQEEQAAEQAQGAVGEQEGDEEGDSSQ